MRARPKSRIPDPIEERRQSDVPGDLVQDILAAIRAACYAPNEVSTKQWCQDRNFLLQRVVLWPAGWLHKRGVTLPPKRYKEVLIGIISDVRRHGNAGAVKYWPGYLAKCVQDHFRHNEDALYNEAKSFRAVLERSVQLARANVAPGQSISAPAPNPIEQLATLSAKVLSRRSPRRSQTTTKQLNLL